MSERSEVRHRILDAAAALLREQGIDAVTTRAVSAAAGVQPPTIYRLFGDMSGLLHAVASSGFEEYLASKDAQPLGDDPVEDLRAGWDLHLRFGLEHPAHYMLMFGRPVTGERTEAAERSLRRLRQLIDRVAEDGRLRVSAATAVELAHAAGKGVVFSLIETDPAQRDLDLPRRMREIVIGAITTDAAPAPRDYAGRASALQAVVGDADGLFSAGERALLGEFLDRLADARPT